jgi:hypothetical protein
MPPGIEADKSCDIDKFFLDIANKLMIEKPGATPSQIASNPTTIQQLEQQFGSKTPAGYTYFGQFVDHDITFDPASSLQRQNDPSGLLNFRTPRLDLDNVYGRGPADQPYLYDQEDVNPNTGKAEKMLIGQIAKSKFPDLPRNVPVKKPEGARALIGDMRNDENAMISQLQLAFLLAHNTLVERARKLKMSDPFEAARRTLRWLYQWVVWNDFLPHVTLKDVHKCALQLNKACGGRKVWECGLDGVYKWRNQPFMPVEFSVAAYRFGHSMVRNSYQTNHPHRGFGSFAPIFDNCSPPPTGGPDDLRGFRRMRLANVIQWDWFLKMTTSSGPFPQNARKIDTKLSNALACLHEGPAGDPLNVLAFRNLKRGWTFGLPSGTDVATKWCVKPAKLGKGEPDALWYYILKEAEQQGSPKGQTLGAVGSIILCATFAGLLKGDPCSFLNMDPCWTPGKDPLLRKDKDNIDTKPDWGLQAIIRLSGLPVDAANVTQVTNNGVTLPV